MCGTGRDASLEGSQITLQPVATGSVQTRYYAPKTQITHLTTPNAHKQLSSHSQKYTPLKSGIYLYLSPIWFRSKPRFTLINSPFAFAVSFVFMNQILRTDVETNKEEKNTEIIYVLFLIGWIYFPDTLLHFCWPQNYGQKQNIKTAL